MRYQRQVRELAVAGLVCAALAGCGSVVASTPGSTPAGSASAGSASAGASAAGTGTAGTAAAGASAAAARLVGCASADEATAVTVRRTIHLVEPVNGHAFTVTVRKPVLVRALFRDLCAAVAHPSHGAPIRCPAGFGTEYLGTFYGGDRVLATFVYGAGGCQPTSLTAAGKTQYTMIFGPAAVAAPHLDTDMAAVLGLKPSELQSPTQINPGGPNKPLRQVARLVEVELAVLDAEHERFPFRLGEVQLVAVWVGRVVHHVQLGRTGLVRSGRSVAGDVDLDPAFLSVVTRCAHAHRLLPAPSPPRASGP
jgi:uncharacterized protein YceK